MKSAVSRYFCANPLPQAVFCRLPGSITTWPQRFRRTCAHLCCLWSTARPPLTSPPLTRRLSDANDEPRPRHQLRADLYDDVRAHTWMPKSICIPAPSRLVCVHDLPHSSSPSATPHPQSLHLSSHTHPAPSDVPPQPLPHTLHPPLCASHTTHDSSVPYELLV